MTKCWVILEFPTYNAYTMPYPKVFGVYLSEFIAWNKLLDMKKSVQGHLNPKQFILIQSELSETE